MSFLDELQKETNKSRTENNAVTNQSTLNPLLDFFSLAGAMRDNLPDATKLFERAYAADKLTAIRTLFYLRDVRGGQGERTIFRSLLGRLQSLDPAVYKKVLAYVPEYGRWDDVLSVGVDGTTAELIKAQLQADMTAMEARQNVSLLAKWLPSENTSSRQTRALARRLTSLLGLTPVVYRKQLSALRKYIVLLEEKMSAREWQAIDYAKLPSQAQRKHVKAFKRHDETRYTEYLAKATAGEAKMNTATLYTYEVFDAVQNGDTDAANAMWTNLPDYTNGSNAIVLADVSGSMSGRPMSVSVSLALYFAEHNTGPFQGAFMTFSAQPQVVKVLGTTLEQKLRNIENAQWDMNTDIEAAFEAILQAAIRSGAQGDDLPKILYIISDMEFDQAVSRPEATLFDNAAERFAAAGFTLPHVVFWNVNAQQIQAPATKFDNRVTLISGLSQTTFRYAVEGKTPEQLMDEVVNGPRYAIIEV